MAKRRALVVGLRADSHSLLLGVWVCRQKVPLVDRLGYGRTAISSDPSAPAAPRCPVCSEVSAPRGSEASAPRRLALPRSLATREVYEVTSPPPGLHLPR